MFTRIFSLTSIQQATKLAGLAVTRPHLAERQKLSCLTGGSSGLPIFGEHSKNTGMASQYAFGKNWGMIFSGYSHVVITHITTQAGSGCQLPHTVDSCCFPRVAGYALYMSERTGLREYPPASGNQMVATMWFQTISVCTSSWHTEPEDLIAFIHVSLAWHPHVDRAGQTAMQDHVTGNDHVHLSQWRKKRTRRPSISKSKPRYN